MATLATQPVTRAGLNPAYVAPSAGGDKLSPSSTAVLHVKNASAAAVTVTLVTPGKVDGFDIADLAVSVPAGGERLIGPVSEVFRDPADGLAAFTTSAQVAVTVAALSV